MKAVKYSTLIIFFISFFVFSASADCPQNIIFIIADGAGFNHINALNHYKHGTQSFEKFPVKLAVTTYPAGGSYEPEKAAKDPNYAKTGLITDSPAAATALATGIKTNNGLLGIDVNENKLENIIERCETLGISTGVITTVPFNDATPAGFASHCDSRKKFHQIADEMINQSGLEVIFGCGNPLFDDDGKKLDEPEFKYISRQMWDSLIAGENKWTLIQSKQEFLNLAEGKTPQKVLGIAQAASTVQQKRGGNSVVPFDLPFNRNVPNLSEMTKAALNVLDDDPDGFFIMIEAGATDWTSHANNSARLIEEMADFADAVDTVIGWVKTESDWQKTLVIITSDHETGGLTAKPAMKWSSKKHTNSLVFFFAKGQGSKLFDEQIKGKDPVYGKYIDNTDIAKVIFTLLEQKTAEKK
ncbi:MAG: alkaline phosphatase [Phycisphaerae bacterium]|nr:alkaline phosphatase [Phycisphaerae bacterium]